MALDPSKLIPLPENLSPEEFKYLDRKGLIEFVAFLNPTAAFELAKREVGRAQQGHE